MGKSTVRRQGRVCRTVGRALALAIAAMAIFASAASAAGTVSTSGTTITYTGGNAVNSVTVNSPSSTSYTFTETGIAETSTSCTLAGSTVTCSGTDWTAVTMNMDDGADVVDASAVTQDAFTINGGKDNDTITGTALGDTINGGNNDDTLNGGDGNDTMSGGSGNDTFNGGNGNDRMDGEIGIDVFNGDVGLDRVIYGTAKCNNLVITIDNTANDSDCAGALDNVKDTVESITGGDGADSITGSCLANTLSGGPDTTDNKNDNDTLNGDPNTCTTNGNDFLGGGDGTDVIDGDGTAGTAGTDTLAAGLPYAPTALNITLDNVANDNDGLGQADDNIHSDMDTIIGGPANDVINASALGIGTHGVSLFGRDGNDTLTGSQNNDFLNGEADTTFDTLDCQGGTNDMYKTDGSETITNCETLVP